MFTSIFNSKTTSKKIVNIGPVGPEIIVLKLKKINASKIYSPVGRFAERAKWFTCGAY